MKMIIAYIRPSALERVTEALRFVDGLTGMSVMEAKGFGRGRGVNYNEITDETNYFFFTPKSRMEIMVTDHAVEVVIETIRQQAYTGEKGEGKIFVLNLENAVRIRTNERGETAI